jgi:hypothetical protein
VIGYDRNVLSVPYRPAECLPRLVVAHGFRSFLSCCFVLRHDRHSACPHQPINPCQQPLQNFVQRHLKTRPRRYTIPPTPTSNVPFDICLQLRLPCLPAGCFALRLFTALSHTLTAFICFHSIAFISLSFAFH